MWMLVAGAVVLWPGTPAPAGVPRGARRRAILAEDHTLATLGRTGDVLAVVGRHGDRALDFVWRHKGALAVGAVLAEFLADPAPFLDGTRRLVVGAADAVTG